MTRLEQSKTYQKRSDPTQEGTHEKPNQARTCQKGPSEKRPEQYIPKEPNQNKPARTDPTKQKRTAYIDHSIPKHNDAPNECEQERVDWT